MLKQIKIKNYALIENLNIDFEPGYSVITGETGAGKSILVGALSLILGNRADTSVLKDKEKKCSVEAVFDIQRFSLKIFFDQNDIDYDDNTIIRREILPEGRSRAFVNDMPVNLSLLKELSLKLIDIHSQHQNLNLADNSFQINIIDTFAKLENEKEIFKKNYYDFLKTKKELEKLIEKAEKEKKDYEFLQFRYDELENAKLKPGEQQKIEKELKEINNIEEITQNLSFAFSVLSDEENGAIAKLREALLAVKNITKFFDKAKNIKERLESVKIETEDISSELENISENIEYDPEKAEMLKERADTLYSLQIKHKVNSADELIDIKNELQKKLTEISSFDDAVKEKTKKLEQTENNLQKISQKLSQGRKKAIPELEKQISEILKKLGMPSSEFIINSLPLNEYTETGKDKIQFLFSANKHSAPGDIAQIASGGEMSRVMLAVKSVIADSSALPVIIFDEIDTGVSGEIAEKTGQIMKKMSDNMQVISITHLPQVAAKADFHYKVYKIEDKFSTKTEIKKLNTEERIYEIAAMLSGENLTDAALKNAEELLK